MKNRFVSLLLVLIMCVSVFTGCSLVTRNDKNYFEATVATISYTDGQKENITKRELISAYNSYGYNYVDNYGYTKEKAVKETLETIINRKLTIKAVEDYYETTGEKVLNGNETTYVWDQTYSSVYNNFKDYFNKVVGKDEDSTTNEDNSSNKIYTPYVKSAYLEYDENDNLVIKKFNPATTIRETYQGRKNAQDVYVDYEYKAQDGSQPFKEMMYLKLTSIFEDDDSQSGKNWRSAYNNYLADVKKNYSYKTFKTDKEWFMFELDRIYEIIKDNYLVEKYSVIFNDRATNGNVNTNVTVDSMLKEYSAKVRQDYVKYSADQTSFEKTMLDDFASIDYVLEGDDATKYFFVGYIKLEMTQEQKDELAKIKADYESGTITDYSAKIDALYSKIGGVMRDDNGDKTNTTISASNLQNEIKNAIANIQYSSEEGDEDYNQQKAYEKADIFRKYMYQYSDSDDLKGVDYNAVFGVKSNQEVLANDNFSENEDIKNAVKEMFDGGNAKIGDTTDFVRTDDGLYMFFYAGEISNLFDGIDGNFDISRNPESIKKLASKRLNVFSTKTLFDSLYSDLANDDAFQVFQNLDADNLRSKFATKIEAIENNLKDLY